MRPSQTFHGARRHRYLRFNADDIVQQEQQVLIHSIKNPEQFAGKWTNRNFFDGFAKNILSVSDNLTFVKTSNFSYQMNGFKGINALKCFPRGDLFHLKFVQEDERFYLKRMPNGTNRILGYEGLKELTD